MDAADVFVLADNALNDVVQQLREEHWTLSFPPALTTRPAAPLSLWQVIGYHAYDDAWVPDMLAGRTMKDVGPGRYDGDLLGDSPQRAFAALVERACAAACAVDDYDRVVHCSFGDVSAREYFWQTSYFRGIRAHDVARVIDVDSVLSPSLVRALWEALSPRVAQWRAAGVLGPEVPVPAGAPLHDRLLGITGREPAGG
ncbi:TIGR03086 family protein [Rhodococcus sp. X156]|uniref:TIGR03086 family protein n=1 Tax=Rhodococcus sp. X156 TaxID=2499145 RepID=UPI000FDB6A34|nr:TIGR03086 family protein [Rhodococcus sp. X156]